ncbi:MAG: superoxide dismutase family protein [Pseudomonadota bacterium]
MPRPTATLLLVSATLISACGKKSADDALLAELAPSEWVDAAANFKSPAGDDIGHVVLADAIGGVLLRVDVKGLAPGWHGIHLHMIADCSDGAGGFKASGAHVDPENHEHGLVNPAGSERGDLPNIYAGADSRATAEFFRAGLNLYPSEQGAATNGPFPLMDDDGFAVIIHANADDHSTQPIGGAGDRVACAAIKG